MHFVMILESVAYTSVNASRPNTYESISWCLSDAGLLVLLCVYWYLLHVGNFDNLSKGRAISWILKRTSISTSFKDIQCP